MSWYRATAANATIGVEAIKDPIYANRIAGIQKSTQINH